MKSVRTGSAALLASLLLLAATPPPPPVAIAVFLSAKLDPHQSGRLIVFVERAKSDTKQTDPVDFNIRAPNATAIVAREVGDLSPSSVAKVDAFPAPFSTLTPE